MHFNHIKFQDNMPFQFIHDSVIFLQRYKQYLLSTE